MIATRAALAALGVLVSFVVACGSAGSESAATAGSQAVTSATSSPMNLCPQAPALGDTVNDHGAERAKGGTATLEAGDFFFAPTCVIDLQKGIVNVFVRNSGKILHNISVADQGIDTDVEPGQSVTVQVKMGTAPVAFVCKYHRTAGMVGALIPAGP